MGGLSNAIDIPDVDLWEFLFAQPKEFSENKSIAMTMYPSEPNRKTNPGTQKSTSTTPPQQPTATKMLKSKQPSLALSSPPNGLGKKAMS
jgi:hypothetical protein